MEIGFIGTGVMGRSMAGHLLEAGHGLTVYNRTRDKAAKLLQRGARWAGTPRQVAANAEVVFTIVGFPHDVERIYFGEDGVLAGLQTGAVAVDMTTSSPELAQRIAHEAAARGAAALDAPVSGGDVGAREARLVIMVGGDEAVFRRVEPLFQLMGQNIELQGPAGSGQHTKLCNQIAIAGTMLAVCEALGYAQRSGLDPEKVITSIGGGAAGSWTLENLAPRMLKGDFAPGFYVKHFLKDMRLARAAADELGMDVPGLATALKRYEELAARGGDDDGTQALFRLYAADDDR